MVKYLFLCLFFFAYASASAQTSNTLSPVADAFVRNGSYAGVNYGSDTSLNIKGSTSTGFSRKSYLKFSLNSLSTISAAKIRIYGKNTDNTSGTVVSICGAGADSWTESGISWSNSPASSTNILSTITVNNQAKYYEFDVSEFVKAQFAGDKTVSFLIQDISNQNRNLLFNSKENKINKPQLVITSESVTPSTALLFVENPDKFPANDQFVFSRIQNPWTRDTVYAANHDSLKMRIHNKGINSLVIKSLVLSNITGWKIDKIKGVKYVAGSSLPISLSSGTFVDLIIKFTAVNQATRVKVLHDTLTIVSNDGRSARKAVLLSGLWQNKGEGSNEPYAQEIINAFGFKTSTGFGLADPNKGDTSLPLSGSEVRPSYFIAADKAKPVSIVQIAAYHQCCNISPSNISWYSKGSGTLNTLFSHVVKDGQTLMPRKSTPGTSASATFAPTTAFGLKIGAKDYTDAVKNTGGKTGIKVWKAVDAKGNIIPNAYFIANGTNYGYQDNIYFVKNVRPEKGTAYFSKLTSTPSALDFGEKVTQTSNSLTLTIASLGKTYADGSKDPAITISSIKTSGENKEEFSAAMPSKTILNPLEKTTVTVYFKPTSQGLKAAELMVYYTNSSLPLRIPVYGIAKTSGTTVSVKYRINSGSSKSLTLNGKTWSADTVYGVGDLMPFTNSKLTQVAGTDDDPLFYKEQHSNAAKKPWSYELPVANGSYVVRLHFAEIYWGVPGGNINGGVGLREMSVAMEGQSRLVNFDPTLEAGEATAIIKNFPVTVADGKLSINFSSTVDRPMVCGVEVYKFNTAANKLTLQDAESGFIKIRAYPNPVRNSLQVEVVSPRADNYELQLIDALGRIYELGKTKLPKGTSHLQINIGGSSLKPGFYFLRANTRSSKPELIKLILE